MRGALLGYLLGVVAAGGLIWIAIDGPDTTKLNLLLLIAGGLIGWIAGILMTPSNVRQEGQFSTYTKILGTFISGYLTAKADHLYSLVVEQEGFAVGGFFFGSMLFVSAFALGMLFTFIWRSYIVRSEIKPHDAAK